MTYRGVLFDSGDTLIGPRGGRWNPRFDFESIVHAHDPDVDLSRLPEAIVAGDHLLRTSTHTPSRADYHRVVLAQIGIDDPPPTMLDALERPLPGVELVEPYPDVIATLERLRIDGRTMAVVSDNWSTLPHLYADLGLAHHFAAIITSEDLGCNKPDPRLYRAGSDALGLDPGDCLYVDDDPDLVQAAIDLGYGGVVIDRERCIHRPGVPTIDSLAALTSMV